MGVTILAWLAIVGGAFAILAAIFAVIALFAALAITGAVAAGGAYAGAAGLAAASMFAIILTIWLAILGVFEIIFGIGALGLKPWAWTVGVVWCYVAAVSDVINIFASRGSGLFSGIIGIAIAVAILYYLYTEEVKAAFGKQASPTPAFLTSIGSAVNKQAAPAPGGYQPPATGGYTPPPAPGAPGAYPPSAPAPTPAPPSAPPAAPAAPEPPAPDAGSAPPAPPAPPA